MYKRKLRKENFSKLGDDELTILREKRFNCVSCHSENAMYYMGIMETSEK